MKFHNASADGAEIAETGDFILRFKEAYYYWLGGTSPFENHGPYDTIEDAIGAYDGETARYSIHDLGDWDHA